MKHVTSNWSAEKNATPNDGDYQKAVEWLLGKNADTLSKSLVRSAKKCLNSIRWKANCATRCKIEDTMTRERKQS